MDRNEAFKHHEAYLQFKEEHNVKDMNFDTNGNFMTIETNDGHFIIQRTKNSKPKVYDANMNLIANLEIPKSFLN